MSPRDLLAEGTMTVRQAAAFTGLSRRTLWRLMDAGLPFVRGAKLRTRLIPKRSLIEYLGVGLYGR